MKALRLFPPAALALVGISIMPVLALMGAGIMWLRERHLLLAWMVLAGLVAVLSWFAVRVIRRPARPPAPLRVPAKAQWSTPGLKAWETVERIAARLRDEARSDGAVVEMDALWALSRELIEAVAAQLHPEAEDPLLEVRVPDGLLAAERFAADLREAVSEGVPGSHVLTIGDVLRGRRLIEHSASPLPALPDRRIWRRSHLVGCAGVAWRGGGRVDGRVAGGDPRLAARRLREEDRLSRNRALRPRTRDRRGRTAPSPHGRFGTHSRA